MSDEQAKIVELKIPDADDAPVTTAPRRYADRCDHHRATVDEEKRTLTCRNPTCNAVLDPIAFLVHWANIRAERNRRAERMEELARERTVHAPGRDGRMTLCGAGSDAAVTDNGVRGQKRGWTVTVSNKRFAIGCKRCRQLLGGREPGRLV